jgi:hypothetical protein
LEGRTPPRKDLDFLHTTKVSKLFTTSGYNYKKYYFILETLINTQKQQMIIVAIILISSAFIGGAIGSLIGYKTMYKTWKIDRDNFIENKMSKDKHF